MTISDDRRHVMQAAAPSRRLWHSRRWRESLFGLVLIVPALAAFLLLIAGPLARGVALAFSRVQAITLKARFAGLDNFQRIFEDSQFFHALWITIQYAVIGVLLQVVVGVGMALLLNQRFYGRAAARGLAIFPYLVPVIVATTVWTWLLHDTYGIVNYWLRGLGLSEQPIAWLADPALALPTVILISTWRVFPFVVIALLGRMQNIPGELYDAARADGASSWAMFWDITLPQLRSVLVVTILLRFIWDFNDFTTVALLTGGGPAERTLTLPILIYQLGFLQHQLGLAAAVADLTLIALTAVFIVYFWTARPLRSQH